MQKKNERRERQPYNITNAITLVCQCILVRIFSTNALIWRVRVYSTKMRLTLNSPCHKHYGRIFLKGSNFLCIVCISFALASDFGAVWVQVMWKKKTLRKRMKDETEQKTLSLPYSVVCSTISIMLFHFAHQMSTFDINLSNSHRYSFHWT